LFGFGRRIPLFVTLQEGKDLSAQFFVVRWLRAWVLRRADRVIAISNFLATYARGITEVPVNVIPNGVDIEQFPMSNAVSEPIVVTASRLVEKNNISNLLRAIACVRAHVPSVRLVVLGDGPLQKSLRELALQLRIHDIVTWRGSISHSEVARCVALSRVFVRVSRSEGLGNAFLEAMALGVPVVASPVGGIVDFISHEATGLMAKPHDVSDITNQIVRLLTDDALYGRIRLQARRLVEERYTWQGIAQSLKHIYDKYGHN
jgi:glycosyltransferase involved in cell wall biosynthesis